RARVHLFFKAAYWKTTAAKSDTAAHRDRAAPRDAGHDRYDGAHHGHARRGAILGSGTLRHVHVDVFLVEPRRLDTESDRAHADVGGRGRDRFFHYVAQVAGDDHLALARHHGGFDGE